MPGSRDTQLIVMAKAPVAGQAKTRLIPALGAEGAARLAARLLDRAMTAARAADLGPVQLACAPDTAHEALVAQAARGGVDLIDQGDGDLGARMQRAFARAFARGARRVILIGTDIPALDAPALREADQRLASHDAVFVPTADGGYGLIGLASPRPALFEHMPWSTPRVMHETRARLAAARLSHVELPTLHDIDEPADLVHLPAGWP